MIEHATLTILGSGASIGVPVLQCGCPVCISNDPRNKRQRTAFLIEKNEKSLLIDAGPDLRSQILSLKRNISLHGVCLTHCHFDHIGGLLDLRPFCKIDGISLSMLLSENSKKVLIEYLLGVYACLQNDIAPMNLHTLSIDSRFIEGFCGFPKIDYCFYAHSGQTVTGYRFGSLAIVTDVEDWNDEVTQFIAGAKVAIIGVGGWSARKGSSHTSIEEVIKYVDELPGLQMVYFTHLSHYIDANNMKYPLPSKYQLAWDGLTVEFSWSNCIKEELS